MNKTTFTIALLTTITLTLSASESWRDPFDINLNVNNQEPIRVDTTFGLSLSSHAVYNMLCLAMGLTGISITYSGLQNVLTYAHNDDSIDDILLHRKHEWWKTSVGLSVTIGSIITLFQFARLHALWNA